MTIIDGEVEQVSNKYLDIMTIAEKSFENTIVRIAEEKPDLYLKLKSFDVRYFKLAAASLAWIKTVYSDEELIDLINKISKQYEG